MASDLHAIVVDGRAEHPARIEAELQRLEQRWSRFISTSDITRINDAAGLAVVVDPATIILVETMINAWEVTAGAYDPSMLPVLIANGYGVSRVDPAMRTELPLLTTRLDGMAAVRVDHELHTVRVPAGVALDAGGIGKGLAADLVAGMIVADGARGCLVSIGGDVAMAGSAPDAHGWTIEVEQVDAVEALCRFTVNGGGVATSSTRSRRWTHDGQPRHHLIDPSTGGQSPTDLHAVTVIARSGWLAEAHATAALLAGSDGVIGYLDANDLSGLAVAADGSVLVTDDLLGLELVTKASGTADAAMAHSRP
jgi:FAD:protein FMN transferase